MSNWTPSIVPGGGDQNVYLVVSDFGRLGLAWCETDVEATDLETIISDLLDGQYTDPVRVVGFNVGERWARDVSEDVADEIRRRCHMQMTEITAHLEAFVERHENQDQRQLTSAWSDKQSLNDLSRGAES
jgi:hypothetical protein